MLFLLLFFALAVPYYSEDFDQTSTNTESLSNQAEELTRSLDEEEERKIYAVRNDHNGKISLARAMKT